MINIAIIIGMLVAAGIGLAGTYGKGYFDGRKAASTDWEQEKKDIADANAKYLIEAAKKSVQVVTQYKTRVEKVEVAGATIREQIPVFIPTPVVLSAGFRVLHDAAATGVPPPAGGIDAATPTVDEVTAAETVARNYEACNLNSEQLKALQMWVIAQLPAKEKQP